MSARYVVRVERQRSGGWRWGLYAPNGHLMASATHYNRRADAMRAARRVERVFAGTFARGGITVEIASRGTRR